LVNALLHHCAGHLAGIGGVERIDLPNARGCEAGQHEVTGDRAKDGAAGKITVLPLESVAHKYTTGELSQHVH